MAQAGGHRGGLGCGRRVAFLRAVFHRPVGLALQRLQIGQVAGRRLRAEHLALFRQPVQRAVRLLLQRRQRLQRGLHHRDARVAQVGRAVAPQQAVRGGDALAWQLPDGDRGGVRAHQPMPAPRAEPAGGAAQQPLRQHHRLGRRVGGQGAALRQPLHALRAAFPHRRGDLLMRPASGGRQPALAEHQLRPRPGCDHVAHPSAGLARELAVQRPREARIRAAAQQPQAPALPHRQQIGDAPLVDCVAVAGAAGDQPDPVGQRPDRQRRARAGRWRGARSAGGRQQHGQGGDLRVRPRHSGCPCVSVWVWIVPKWSSA